MFSVLKVLDVICVTKTSTAIPKFREDRVDSVIVITMLTLLNLVIVILMKANVYSVCSTLREIIVKCVKQDFTATQFNRRVEVRVVVYFTFFVQHTYIYLISIILFAECVCDLLGSTSKVCNHTTGQCSCHPNVIGLSCDKCELNHWKIASGNGCEACNCDPVGSLSEQCNQV